MINFLWGRYTRDERVLAFVAPGSVLGLVAAMMSDPSNGAALLAVVAVGTPVLGLALLPLIARWSRKPAEDRIRI